MMNGKKPTTILLTHLQLSKLREESEKTGNSQNSIVRTALENYFQSKMRPYFGV